MNQWQPSAGLAALQARAQLYRRIRAFFEARAYLEVDTPLLGRAGTTDPAIESFRSSYLEEELFLQTSPEFFMKRLLAAGSGSIYAISKVFRRDEQGRHHNPEFSLLEWYRLGFDDRELMAEVGDLLSELLSSPLRQYSYREIFQQHLALDPHSASVDALQRCARQHLDLNWEEGDRDTWLDLLFSHLIQPQLQQEITFIYDYPASQAALARVIPESTGELVARRFEVFYAGIELANGYWELTEAAEQARRFAADARKREAAGQPPVRADDRLVAALAQGLPDCAGVALGLDRLLMLVVGASSIEEVIAFPYSRL